MTDSQKAFLQRWFVTTLGVLVAATVVDGVHADGVAWLLAASLLLGVLNAILRPLLLIATLPLIIFTFGIFVLVINALLLYFVAYVLKEGFVVVDFWAAFKGAIIISVVSLFANMALGKKRTPTENKRPRAVNRPKPPADTGTGPVIDI